EPVGDVLAQYRRRKRPETFAVLDLEVERFLHGWRPWIAKDRSGAERARSELHASLEPANRLTGSECLSGGINQNIVLANGEFRAHSVQPTLDFGLIESWAEIGA